MDYEALATDYDGTLATEGRVDEPTLAALRSLRASGRKLLMVTGRELPDLKQVCPHLHLFDRIVVENGALLFHPESGAERVLAPPPPEAFARTLRERGVSSLGTGRVIVATWEHHHQTVLQTIADLKLDLEVILNKRAVMVLPRGVTKATGLAAALSEMQLDPTKVVGVGDAENDLDLLKFCGCGAAVGNALPQVKQAADIVTKGERGAGVREISEALLRGELKRKGD